VFQDGAEVVLDEGPFVLFDGCGACESAMIVDFSGERAPWCDSMTLRVPTRTQPTQSNETQPNLHAPDSIKPTEPIWFPTRSG
jgi:hypothetical protein